LKEVSFRTLFEQSGVVNVVSGQLTDIGRNFFSNPQTKELYTNFGVYLKSRDNLLKRICDAIVNRCAESAQDFLGIQAGVNPFTSPVAVQFRRLFGDRNPNVGLSDPEARMDARGHGGVDTNEGPLPSTKAGPFGDVPRNELTEAHTVATQLAKSIVDKVMGEGAWVGMMLKGLGVVESMMARCFKKAIDKLTNDEADDDETNRVLTGLRADFELLYSVYTTSKKTIDDHKNVDEDELDANEKELLAREYMIVNKMISTIQRITQMRLDNSAVDPFDGINKAVVEDVKNRIRQIVEEYTRRGLVKTYGDSDPSVRQWLTGPYDAHERLTPDTVTAGYVEGMLTRFPVANLTKQHFDWFLENNVPFPMEFILARPHISEVTGTVVVMKRGADTGTALIGNENFCISNDGMRKMLLGHLSLYLGCSLHRPENICIIHNAIRMEYISGGDLAFNNPATFVPNSMAAIDNTLAPDSKRIKSCYAIPIHYGEKVGSRDVQDVIDITGFFPDGLVARSGPEDVQQPHFSTYWIFQDIFGLQRRVAYWTQANINEAEDGYNTRCCQGTSYTYMVKGEHVERTGILVEGRGHGGPEIYNGVCNDAYGRGRHGYIDEKSFTRPYMLPTLA
jgi:hypothetical protein